MHRTLFLVLVACNDYSLVEREDDTDTDVAPIDTDNPPPPTPPGPTDAPVAECSVAPNPVTPPFEAATFDGSGSYDPNGLQITAYNWELSEKPAGSAATMPAGGATRGNFVPDLAGMYVGRLTVVNEAGVTSAACEAELEAIPAQNLWVEMYWDQAGDDMDLHLLAPGGAPRSPLDCYYGNCIGGGALDWGVIGVESDDPRLDLDDVPGMGPENINIDQPAGGGGYTVMVHDFGTGDPQSTNVTVNVYLNGALVWTDTRLILGDNTETNFAQIDWTTGTVTTL
jgi:hypothetical protein